LTWQTQRPPGITMARECTTTGERAGTASGWMANRNPLAKLARDPLAPALRRVSKEWVIHTSNTRKNKHLSMIDHEQPKRNTDVHVTACFSSVAEVSIPERWIKMYKKCTQYLTVL